MSLDPTERCAFCGNVYYVWKLVEHESICSMRPKKLTIARAVRIAVKAHPEAFKDRALLVRLAWQILDGYRTAPPMDRLTDPRLVLARAGSATR
jgi:hypothetical protein